MKELKIRLKYELGQKVHVCILTSQDKIIDCPLCKKGLPAELAGKECPLCFDTEDYEITGEEQWRYKGEQEIIEIRIRKDITPYQGGISYMTRQLPYIDSKRVKYFGTQHEAVSWKEIKNGENNG